jgi:hypothetical protein
MLHRTRTKGKNWGDHCQTHQILVLLHFYLFRQNNMLLGFRDDFSGKSIPWFIAYVSSTSMFYAVQFAPIGARWSEK